MRVIAATTVSLSILSTVTFAQNSCQLKAPNACTDDIDYLNCVLSDQINALNVSVSGMPNGYDGCKHFADSAGFCTHRPSEMSMYCCNVHAQVCLTLEENIVTDDLPPPPPGIFFDIEESTVAPSAASTVAFSTSSSSSSSTTTSSTTSTTMSTATTTSTTTSISKSTATTTTTSTVGSTLTVDPLTGVSLVEVDSSQASGSDREQGMAGAEAVNEFNFCRTLDKYVSLGATITGKLRALFPQLFPSQAVIDQSRALSQKFPGGLFPKLQDRRSERSLQEEEAADDVSSSLEDLGLIDLQSLLNAETITMLIETMIAPGLGESGINFTAVEEEMGLFAHMLVVKLEACDNCLLGLIRATAGPLFEEATSDDMKKLEQKRIIKSNESALIKMTAEEFSYRLVIAIDRFGDEIEAVAAAATSRGGKSISLTQYIDDLLTVTATIMAEDDLGGLSANAMSIALTVMENMKDSDVLADVIAEASLLYDAFGCDGSLLKDEEPNVVVPAKRMLQQQQLRGDDEMAAGVVGRALLRDNGSVDVNTLMTIILEKQIEARDETMQLMHEKSLVRNTRSLQGVDQKQSNFIPDIRVAQDGEPMLEGQPCEDHPEKIIASLETRYKDVSCGALISEVGCAAEGFFVALPEIVKACKGSWWVRCAAVLETMPKIKELVEGSNCESEAIVDGFGIDITAAPTSAPTTGGPSPLRGGTISVFSHFPCVVSVAAATLVFFM